MSLRMQVAADARAILEDVGAFSWPVSVTSPDGVTVQLQGSTKDIAQKIDPETGMLVSGRSASATLPIGALAAAGLGIPRNVPEKTSKPWVIRFYDTAQVLHSFKVVDTLPDHTNGIVVCILEAYRAPTP